MPTTNYLNITIASQPVDVQSIEDFPIAVNYSLEDPEDFQKKESNTAFDVKLPATLRNRMVANSFHSASIDDATTGQQYRGHQPAVIEADGQEVLNGKAFLTNATHSANPLEYQYSFYGGSADWLIDLKEKTIYDFLSRITFVYSKENVEATWDFDGTDENVPYVFAPVRYRGLMDDVAGKDDNVLMTYLRPSISKYWIIVWAYRSLGYRVQSEFMDTEYFRRQVMPWTWGNFNKSEGTTLDVHLFSAKSLHERFVSKHYDGWLDLYVSNKTTEGMFDNNNNYTYAFPSLIWEYKQPFFGKLDANFATTVTTNGGIVGSNSFFDYTIHWFHIPVTTGIEEEFKVETILSKTGRNLPGAASRDYFEQKDLFANYVVNPGDKIIARFKLVLHEGSGVGARVNFHSQVLEYKLAFFRTPVGGTINFSNYTGFKKYKFLDFLAGVLDEFNISPVTDNINKVVYLEPSHKYNVDGTPRTGYFNEDYIFWQQKADISKEWDKILYSDYEKEVTFKYKDDTNDGALKIVQDRNQNILSAGKYLFPDRFKAGKREHENRFFAATMHCDLEQFKGVTGVAPQMVVIVPENISNTSNSEADNTFTPKSCYYKGKITGVGGWKYEGNNMTEYPYMFAVNYKPGGESDPVLSYSDENINGVVAQGLMKRFFWQRLATMRNGEFYQAAYFKLNNTDVNRLHREFKIYEGQKWELVQINNYLPLKDESTACYMRKWSPITEQDDLNSFPSEQSVNGNATVVANDIKYAPLKCLLTDIPK